MSTPKSVTEKQESESFNHGSLSESLDTFLNPSSERVISNFDGLKSNPKPSAVNHAEERRSSLLPDNLRLMSGLISGSMATRIGEGKASSLQNTSIISPSMAQEAGFPSYQRYEHAIAEQEHQERNGVNMGEFLNTSDIFDAPYCPPYKGDFPPQLAAHSCTYACIAKASIDVLASLLQLSTMASIGPYFCCLFLLCNIFFSVHGQHLPEYHSPYMDATKLAQMNAHMQQAQGSIFLPEGSQGTNYTVKK